MPSSADPTEVTDPDDLYSLSLEHFVEARDRLKGRLAADGHDDEAARIGKLRKPSLAAWAINRASRHRPDAVERLVASHRALRAADSAETLRAASDERHDAVTALEEAAVAELTADGRSASGATRSRITSTLLAVATDDEGAADLVAGRLVRDLEPSGAGWGDIALAPPPEPRPADRAVAAAERARAEADKLEKLATIAEHDVELAKRALGEARRRAKEARAQADRAIADAEQAERAAGISAS